MASRVPEKKKHPFIHYLLLVLAFLLLAWGIYMYFEWKIKSLEHYSNSSKEVKAGFPAIIASLPYSLGTRLDQYQHLHIINLHTKQVE